MSRQFKPCVTPEEYLALERKADYRSDYLHGEIFAMTGAGGVSSIAGSVDLQSIGCSPAVGEIYDKVPRD